MNGQYVSVVCSGCQDVLGYSFPKAIFSIANNESMNLLFISINNTPL